MAGTPSSYVIRMASIGNVCAQWAGLEYQISHIIWLMLDLRHEVGKIMTGGLDMQPRLNVAILLARQLGAPRYIERELARIRKEIQDGLDMQRNRAVHGISFESPDPNSLRVEVHRGKGTKTPIELPNKELNKLGDDLHGLANAAHQIFDRMWEDEKLLERLAIARKIRTDADETVSIKGSKSPMA